MKRRGAKHFESVKEGASKVDEWRKHVNAIKKPQADRRHADRFPIEREVRYRSMNKRGSDETGEGKTVNMSSSGVLFTSQHLLLPGKRMELAISWPAQLNDKCALKLIARGRIVRFENGKAAFEIQQYEFKTHSAAAQGKRALGPAHPVPGL